MSRWESVAEEVIRSRGQALIGYATLFAPDLGDAEDLVHDALVRTFSRTRGITDVVTAEVYVKRAIRTAFVDSLRKKRSFTSRQHLLHADESTAGPEQAYADASAVTTALAALPPRQRACVALRYYDDMPLAEIAAELGISLGGVKRYLSDAAATLRTQLGVAVEDDIAPEDETVVLRTTSVPTVEGGKR